MPSITKETVAETRTLSHAVDVRRGVTSRYLNGRIIVTTEGRDGEKVRKSYSFTHELNVTDVHLAAVLQFLKDTNDTEVVPFSGAGNAEGTGYVWALTHKS